MTLVDTTHLWDDIIQDFKRRIEHGSKSFAGAARLLSLNIRYDTYILYAWCRYCDDQIDSQSFGHKDEAALQRNDNPEDRLTDLRAQTQNALDGNAQDPIFAGLAHVITKHNIPHHYPLDLLDGFEMDVRQTKFQTLEDTLKYSYHVAGVVGIMMAQIMGIRQRTLLQRAADLGLAFQLTNIARDVMDDAAMGRVYLPENWLNEYGVSYKTIADKNNRPAVAQVVARLLEAAEDYYKSAEFGIFHLPTRSALAISAAKQIYRHIGLDVKARGAKAWDKRIVVPKHRKLWEIGVCASSILGSRVLGILAAEPERVGLWSKIDYHS